MRKGDCSFCGFCCRFPFDPVALFFPDGDPKLAELLKVRGFVHGTSEGKPGWYSLSLAYQKCPHHINERCALWGKPERPQMCHDFPEKPSQVKATPCSYWFEDEEGVEKPIGGEGSPYPSGQVGISESSTLIDAPPTSDLHEGMMVQG